MLIMTHETVVNPAVLETRSLPKKFFGRVLVLPRKASFGQWLRLGFELQALRYLGALLPFAFLPLVFQETALPITQAPLVMLLVVGVVELKVLRLSDGARDRLMTKTQADRIHDAFRFRAKQKLRAVAAKQGLTKGELVLVVEQSEIARVRPLTLISVQRSHPSPEVLDLSEAERAELSDLFDVEVTERDFHRANQKTSTFLHTIEIDVAGLSAHARMAAWAQANSVDI